MDIFLQSLPHFGPYRKQREHLTAEQKVIEDLLDEKYHPEPHRPARQPVHPVPRVKVCRQTAWWRHDDVISHLFFRYHNLVQVKRVDQN